MSEPEEESSFENATPVIPFSARELPASEPAEKSLLGCCLLDEGPSLDRALAAGLTPESFFWPKHTLVFSHLREMRRTGQPITTESLAAVLMESKQLASLGGPMFLVELTSGAPTTTHAGALIEKVREKQILRETILAASKTLEEAYAFAGDLPSFLDLARERLPHPDVLRGTNGAFTVWQPAAFRAYTPPLNMNLIGGGYLRRRQLTTLIGPPGVGKSRLSLWLACLHNAGRPFASLGMLNGPARWLFFGNENDPMRQKSDLDWFYRNLTTAEQARCDANLFLHVVDSPSDGIITLADPDAYHRLRASLKEIKPDVVVFDPWGNMIEGNENDNEEVRRTLKLLIRAVSENCPDAAILVIHHARTGKQTAIEAGNNYSGGNLSRGSKALVSSARCELALWPGDAEDSSKLVLTCEKANNVVKFEPLGLRFENGIYREDDAFELKAWRDDIEGKRSGKTLTIADLVSIVKGGIYKSSDIISAAEQTFGVSKRTSQTRLSEAVAKGYLQKTMPSGSYTLGNTKTLKTELKETSSDDPTMF